MDSPPGVDFLHGSPGILQDGDTTTVPDVDAAAEKSYSVVNSFILNNPNILKQVNDLVGKDIPFQKLDEDERKSILLIINQNLLDKVYPHTLSHYKIVGDLLFFS